jgi:hypothetical protein
MSRCVRSDKNRNQRIITQIGEKEYLIEGYCDWAKFGCQFDPAFITSANIESGPFLLVGDSFLGKGEIANIQNIENDQEDYFILKITLY